MAISKQKKVEIIKKVSEIIKAGQSLVFVNFHGLSVSAVNEIRRALESKGMGYYVAKKTLIKRAFGDSSVTGELPPLDGEVAIAWGDDALAPIKEVYDFQKKNADALKIIGGVFEGAFAPAEQILTLAKIPSREVLYGQFVNVINSPIQGLVIALDAIARQKSEVTN